MGYEPWPFEKEEEEEQISHGCSAFSHEMQLFPNIHETDGFYICRWKTK
jgi:16S rRNA C967 or C1407 C5-methylase (RsmB/RsmF family)